ncbi:tail completion protein gp17 [Sphingomonas sp. Leaf257]|jgi:hypothetical protein|uniref:tail completion protein gp17 n=1 Tax=Sphingomonas sp. Leaf257 TaxID=1736309 RepID=UPI0006F1E109|nr:DUF3168 domain-containing protein [Sphingomonas sp. Leaf257]KQO51407.1 hypothetical protein ASF14_07875 [Sphingomonas sp. Leaf257]
MTSATAAVEATSYDVLHLGITGAPVFQDVPDDQPLPVVIIGEMLSAPYGRANDPDRRITLTIIVLTEGDERRPCSDIQDQIEALLAGKSFKRLGWNFHYSIASSAAELAGDGSGYIGTTILTILAFSDS